MKKLMEFEIVLQEFCAMEKEGKKIYYKDYHDSYDFPQPREIQISVQKICEKKYPTTYQTCRAELAKQIPTIQTIAENLGINSYRVAHAPAAIGGTMYEIEIFNSLLEQAGYTELEATVVFDTLNKMQGKLKENIKSEWHRILNPLTWISFVLKIPFLLIKQTGFNVDKIENELWGKLIKTACLILLIWILLRWGFTKDQLAKLFSFK